MTNTTRTPRKLKTGPGVWSRGLPVVREIDVQMSRNTELRRQGYGIMIGEIHTGQFTVNGLAKIPGNAHLSWGTWAVFDTEAEARQFANAEWKSWCCP